MLGRRDISTGIAMIFFLGGHLFRDRQQPTRFVWAGPGANVDWGGASCFPVTEHLIEFITSSSMVVSANNSRFQTG